MYPVQCTVQVQYAGPVTSASNRVDENFACELAVNTRRPGYRSTCSPFPPLPEYSDHGCACGPIYISCLNTRPMCEFTRFRAAPSRAFLPMLARGFVVEGMVGSYRIPPIVGTKVNRAVPPVTERDFCVCCGLGANVRSPISRCRDNRASERRAHPIPPTARIGIAAHSCIRWLAARAHCTRRPLTIMLHVAWCLDPARA